MRRVICLVPSADLFDPNVSTFKDIYKVSNNCSKRAAEAGAIPVGLAPVDEWIPEGEMELFDGYLVQGGGKFYPYHYQIMHDAYENGKRYLGLCLGAQLIHSYLMLRRKTEELGYTGDLIHAMWKLKCETDFVSLEDVPGHRMPAHVRGNEESVKHGVDVLPGTILRRLVGRDNILGASYHDLRIPNDTPLTINARASHDPETVEGVELGPNILGVQFHPEIDDTLPEIFRFLTED